MVSLDEDEQTLLRTKMGNENYQKFIAIDNPKIHKFVAKYVKLCNPDRVFVGTDSEEDLQYQRDACIKNKEEVKLKMPNHTLHFDGFNDQARDKSQTYFLLPPGESLGEEINSMDREKGLEEIHEILRDIMVGHELYVRFFCLGPPNSVFTMPCLQLTDSAYVAHSEDLLYRQGYEQFKGLGDNPDFFKFVHSQGELEPAGLGLGVSKNIDKRRVYIDLEGETIYSTNTQYGGNTIGLKKLAMRLGINRASKEDWLTEHMFIMGVYGPNNRVSYFTGAFPSMCGKTSTAMIDGELIVGDDIAYLRNINGKMRAVNVESGIFGIIQGINSKDDHLQWQALHSGNEIIFTNQLYLEDGTVYWNGKDGEVPTKGVNHSGDWYAGKTYKVEDKETGELKDVEINPSHKNARFTIDMKILPNLDPRLNDPEGVPISGVIYGGRDPNTWVPVFESFDWSHGIITMGAALESLTTAATLGGEGKRVFNPMSNIDFLSITIGKYVLDNIEFGKSLNEPPKVFAVNYFLMDDEEEDYLNSKNDKRIWLKWMELRANGEAEAIETPIGYIPKYEDLKRLFHDVYQKEYTKEDYDEQFKIRVTKNLERIQRTVETYNDQKIVPDPPEILFEVLEKQRERLNAALEKYGEHIYPDQFE
jgi:phosphoenolpyruvate carboxykinase (GTP)